MKKKANIVSDKPIAFNITLVNPMGDTLTTVERAYIEKDACVDAAGRITNDAEHRRYGPWIAIKSTRAE